MKPRFAAWAAALLAGSACGSDFTSSGDGGSGDSGGSGGTTTSTSSGTGGSTTSSGSATGGQGGEGECTTATDCAVPAALCFEAWCNASQCEDTPRAEGKELPVEHQIAGDCQVKVCDGQGNQVVAPADDPPADPNTTDCTVPVCHQGQVESANAPKGSPCGLQQLRICCEAGACCEGPTCMNPGNCYTPV